MPSQKDDDIERVKRATKALGEHFDTVQIFVTRHEEGQEGGTVNVAWSQGNWFARYGQVREWVVKADERTRKSVREEMD